MSRGTDAAAANHAEATGDDDLALGADTLRKRLRALIAESFPPEFLGAFTDDPHDLDLTEAFCRRLADEGLLALAWPAKYGGGGANVWLQTVVREEMWAHHEPRGAQYMGLNWVGPAIMRFGTDRQKTHHLPLIARGEVRWCQGFSEPNAGSDLAALTTAAIGNGTGWRVNGQKIWTSYAETAHYCMLAARISNGPRRHEGITLFMLPMDRAGIEVRPIASMLGPLYFNEIFLNNVAVDEGDVLGDVGDGWAVIRYILRHERVGIARYARCDRLLNLVRESIADTWSSSPQSLRVRFARNLVHNRVTRLLSYSVVAAMERGEVDDAAAAVARVSMTRGDQETTDTLVELVGADCLVPDKGSDPIVAAAVEEYWRYAQASTVASGAIEIQQSLIARSVLGRDVASSAA